METLHIQERLNKHFNDWYAFTVWWNTFSPDSFDGEHFLFSFKLQITQKINLVRAYRKPRKTYLN